jgi:hypothetical protein
MEAAQGLLSPATYNNWSANVKELIEHLCVVVADAKANGYAVIGYGAAAKGNTLLNSAKIKLDAIVDDNPLKQGLYSPGMNVPIVPIEFLDTFAEDARVMFVPLAWNFYKEIKQRIKAKRTNENDLFLRYFPEVITER